MHDPSTRDGALALAAWALTCTTTRFRAMEIILGDMWIHHADVSPGMHWRYDSRKWVTMKSLQHRIKYNHPMTRILKTIRIQLPWFINFQRESTLAENLQRVASPNDRFGVDAIADQAMAQFYPIQLRPFTALCRVIFSLPSSAVSLRWPWGLLENMALAFVREGKEIDLVADIRCINAPVDMSPSPHVLFTSFGVIELTETFGDMVAFARVLKRLERGLKYLTIEWDARLGEL
jgi:hypothetical protein